MDSFLKHLLAMHDFSRTGPKDMYYDVPADQIKFFKGSKSVLIMCEVMGDMRNESLQEGLREGLK